MAELNPPFKKRTVGSKVDRRLSPLNPAALRDESEPTSPLSSINIGSVSAREIGTNATLAYQPPLEDTNPLVRKKSIGLVLRRVATNAASNQMAISGSSSNYASDSEVITGLGLKKRSKRDQSDNINRINNLKLVNHVAVADNLLKHRRKQAAIIENRRSLLTHRSASLCNLPKWSPSVNNTLSALTTSKDFESSPGAVGNSKSRNVIHITAVTPQSTAEKLELLASSLTTQDISKYTTVVENSRRAKNFLWHSEEPVAIWPDWHESIGTAPNFYGTPLSPLLIGNDIIDLPQRPPSRGRSTASPVLNPLPIPRERSNSPGRFLDSTNSDEMGDSKNRKVQAAKLRSSLVIITNREEDEDKPVSLSRLTPSIWTTPLFSGSSQSSKQHNRAQSDGDLSEYLKGFSDLKGSLELAQRTCNSEISKILSELQQHVEQSVKFLVESKHSADLSRDPLGSGSFGSKSSLLGSTFSLAQIGPDSPEYRKGSGMEKIGSISNAGARSMGSFSSQGSVRKTPDRTISKDKLATTGISSSIANNTLNPILTRDTSVNHGLVRENSLSQGIMRENSLSHNLVRDMSLNQSAIKESSFYGEPFFIEGYSDSEFSFSHSRSDSRSRSKSPKRFQSGDALKLASDLKLSDKDEDMATPFMQALNSVISLAQNILSLDIKVLMNPAIPKQYIIQIQELLTLWHENPEWQFQEIIVRLMIVFASVARLAEHFDEDFRSWSDLSFTLRNQRLPAIGIPNKRRESTSSFKSSLKVESPLSFSFRNSAFSAQGTDSSDMGDYDDFSDDYNSQYSPPRKLYNSSKKKTSEKRSLLEFRAAVSQEQSVNVLLEMNPLGEIIYISPGVERIFHYTQSEILNSSTVLFLVDDRNVFSEAAAQTRKDKTSISICVDAKRADGVIIKIECNGLANYDVQTEELMSIVWLIKPLKSGIDDSQASYVSDLDIIPNVDMALCNICDKSVPAIHFAFHTDICLSVHKTEMDLVLLNDEVRSLKSSCSERLDLVELEKLTIENEISKAKESGLDFPGNQDIVSFLGKIHALGCAVRKWMDEFFLIRRPKLESNDASYEAIFLKFPSEVPNNAEFKYAPTIDNSYANHEAIESLGSGLYVIAVRFQECLNQKKTLTFKLTKDLVEYLECLEAEQGLIIEIGLQTSAISRVTDGDEFEDNDTKYEMKYIGGVRESNNDSLLFSSLSDSVPDDESHLQNVFPNELLRTSDNIGSPLTRKPATRSFSKNSTPLRIQTGGDDDSLSNERRHSVVRNPRMVVGDKSIEIEFDQLLSPSNSRMPSPLPRANTTFKPSPASPRASTNSPAGNLGPLSGTSSFGQIPNPLPRGNSGLNRGAFANRGQSFSINPSTPTNGGLNSFASNFSLTKTASTMNSNSTVNTTAGPSIKDYDIIKPISKGAFGSVFLAKKKISGQYFAIKVLRKADMVAKNQATNIKSERTILTQLDSPYVVKLFSTFQSKNHIYLVMEYLNGGDCAALLKSMGQLDNDWAKQYISEMVQGLEFLHDRDIVHRDLKPDNILIDISGHIKLTDFGLSKAGFLGRRAIGVGDIGRVSTSGKPSSAKLSDTNSSGGSFFIPAISPFKTTSRRTSTASNMSNESSASRLLLEKLEERKREKKLVGTPDYLAPESILGLGQGVSVDWWAVGVILYEFLYGIPPFNAETPSLVFENILLQKIDWGDGEAGVSLEARKLMEGLICHDVEKRVGTRSASEVKNMSWFEGTDWDNLHDQKVFFVPSVRDIEDTDYFDARGVVKPCNLSDSDESVGKSNPSESNADEKEDFGEGVLKNLPLLEKANQKTLNKINQDFPEGEQWGMVRRESMSAIPNSPGLNAASPILLSANPFTPGLRSVSPLHFSSLVNQRRDSLPSSPTFSAAGSSSIRSMSPKKASRLISSSSASLENLYHFKNLEYSESPRLGPFEVQGMGISVNSFSSNHDVTSVPKNEEGGIATEASNFKDENEEATHDRKKSQAYLDIAKQNLRKTGMSSQTDVVVNNGPMESDSAFKVSASVDKDQGQSFDVLIAESNPATALILENILQTVNCRCVRVDTGAEVVQCAMGDVKFDMIFCDVVLPVMNGGSVARMIKFTSNINSQTPIFALCVENEDANLEQVFNHVITKPITQVKVMNALHEIFNRPSENQ